MIDPAVRNINRLSALLFKNGDNNTVKDSCDKYCMSLAEINSFNVLIDNKPFFDQPVKNKQEVYQKLVKMSRNNEYTTENLLDYRIIKIFIN